MTCCSLVHAIFSLRCDAPDVRLVVPVRVFYARIKSTIFAKIKLLVDVREVSYQWPREYKLTGLYESLDVRL